MSLRCGWITLCVVGLSAMPLSAQPAGTGPVDLERALYEGLRDVINHGAKVFNEQGDYHGCVRIYQGGLVAVKPLLAHRPDVQKNIDAGLAKTNDIPRAIDRAFALRQVLDQVRESIRPAGVPVPEKKEYGIPEKLPLPPAKKLEPKPPTKKVEEKKQPPALQASGVVQGRVSLMGKPLATGYVTFLDKAADRTFSTYLRDQGEYRFRHPLPPGRYTVYFGPSPTEPGTPVKEFNVSVPLLSPATSALVAEVRPENNEFNFDLPGKTKP